MRVCTTREFARFARREGIRDARLREAAERAERGLVDADLGGGLIKQRVARQGEGRRGGYRTLMAFRAGQLTVFLYGFAKSERDNIGPDELDFWRRVARGFLEMDAAQWPTMTTRREIVEVADGQGGLSNPAAGGAAQDRGSAASRRRARQGDDA